MLKKTQRISKNQVGWIHKKGNKFNNEFFSVKFLLNKLNYSRYSIVVSKKTVSKAVDRNLIRRQLYEIIRLTPPPEHYLDYIISVKPALIDLSFTKKEDRLKETFKHISSKTN